MPSVQIHPRIDKEIWEGLRLPGEKDTQLLQRLVAESIADKERCERLRAIDSNLDVALGTLERSHQILNQMIPNVSLSVLQQPTEPVKEPAQKTQKKKYDVSKY